MSKLDFHEENCLFSAFNKARLWTIQPTDGPTDGHTLILRWVDPSKNDPSTFTVRVWVDVQHQHLVFNTSCIFDRIWPEVNRPFEEMCILRCFRGSNSQMVWNQITNPSLTSRKKTVSSTQCIVMHIKGAPGGTWGHMGAPDESHGFMSFLGDVQY